MSFKEIMVRAAAQRSWRDAITESRIAHRILLEFSDQSLGDKLRSLFAKVRIARNEKAISPIGFIAKKSGK
jgi:hypothetical protein